jgi:hypothetical protein
MIDREQVLLVEYGKAQDSAQHFDSLLWSVTSITWGAMMVLFGFVVSKVGEPGLHGLLTCAAMLGLGLLAFQWATQNVFASVRRQKYNRCKEIGVELQISQHTLLDYSSGYHTFLYRLVSVLFAIAWIYALLRIWELLP